MSRLATALAVCLVSCPQLASAHEVAAVQKVQVQTDPEQFGILVTWTSSTGGMSEILSARAGVGKNREKALLRASLNHALHGVVVTINGNEVKLREGKSKLVYERGKPGRRRHGVALLWSTKVEPGAVIRVAMPKGTKKHPPHFHIENRCKEQCVIDATANTAHIVYQ